MGVKLTQTSNKRKISQAKCTDKYTDNVNDIEKAPQHMSYRKKIIIFKTTQVNLANSHTSTLNLMMQP